VLVLNRIGIVYHEKISEYDFGPGHPFRGNRFKKYMDLLEEKGILYKEGIEIIKQEPATDEELQLIHPHEYLRKVRQLANLYSMLTPDTPLSPSIANAARLIVGGGLKAAELVSNGYNLVDSIGGGLHHAGPDYGGGFCVYNDVAICAKTLIEKYGFERVLIFDTDVHAGNGTMDIFYKDPKVLFIDIHQDPLTIYPGRGFIEDIGEDEGRGFTVNIPLPPFVGDEEVHLVLERVFRPLVKQFKPEIIIRNGGSDPHFNDLLGSLQMTYEGFHNLGKTIREAAIEQGVPVINMSCSGYNPKTVGEGMYALLNGLMNQKLDVREEEQPTFVEHRINEVENIIEELAYYLKDYWNI
jgi:acetoin utilization protein AcuC